MAIFTGVVLRTHDGGKPALSTGVPAGNAHRLGAAALDG